MRGMVAFDAGTARPRSRSNGGSTERKGASMRPNPHSPRLALQKFDIQEWLGRNLLISDMASGIDEEHPVEGAILEFIVALEGFRGGDPVFSP